MEIKSFELLKGHVKLNTHKVYVRYEPVMGFGLLLLTGFSGKYFDFNGIRVHYSAVPIEGVMIPDTLARVKLPASNLRLYEALKSLLGQHPKVYHTVGNPLRFLNPVTQSEMEGFYQRHLDHWRENADQIHAAFQDGLVEQEQNRENVLEDVNDSWQHVSGISPQELEQLLKGDLDEHKRETMTNRELKEWVLDNVWSLIATGTPLSDIIELLVDRIDPIKVKVVEVDAYHFQVREAVDGGDILEKFSNGLQALGWIAMRPGLKLVEDNTPDEDQ